MLDLWTSFLAARFVNVKAHILSPGTMVTTFWYPCSFEAFDRLPAISSRSFLWGLSMPLFLINQTFINSNLYAYSVLVLFIQITMTVICYFGWYFLFYNIQWLLWSIIIRSIRSHSKIIWLSCEGECNKSKKWVLLKINKSYENVTKIIIKFEVFTNCTYALSRREGIYHAMNTQRTLTDR